MICGLAISVACFSVCCATGSVLTIFVFEQKTAYELRISDWSSDVCSSDLALPALDVYVADSQIRYLAPLYEAIEAHAWLADASRWQATVLRELGRASCRERVCQSG